MPDVYTRTRIVDERANEVRSTSVFAGSVPGDVSGSLPPGGLAGQVLAKASSANGDVTWNDPIPSPIDGGTFN